MRYRVTHITTYKYSDKVTHCYNLANLIPKNMPRQKRISNRIIIAPSPLHSSTRTDYFGNESYHFEIQKAHTELSITAESVVEMSDANKCFDLDLGMSYGEALDYLNRSSEEIVEAKEFLLDSPMVKVNQSLIDYARPSFSHSRPLEHCVAELTNRIFEEFTYTPGFTTIATPLSDVLEHKRGVCQDFAHLQVACLRSMGIPAKYVSGYMETLPPPGQEKLVGADATHAWISYFSPGIGWIEHDPTNDVRPSNQHIVTAEGRDYNDVTPLKGVIFGGGDSPLLNVSVDVARL